MMGEASQKLKSFVFLLAISASGHSHALDSDAKPVGKAIINCPAVCPSQEFSKFLKAFSEHKDTQMAFTKYPLKRQQLDLNAEPEPKPVIKSLGRHQIEFPLIPDELERKAKSLTLRIDKVTSKKAKLTLLKIDTDYQVSYFFSKSGCWKLERIEDWSL